MLVRACAISAACEAGLHQPSLHTDMFHYAFTNTLVEGESRAVWERYAIPAPGNWVWVPPREPVPLTALADARRAVGQVCPAFRAPSCCQVRRARVASCRWNAVSGSVRSRLEIWRIRWSLYLTVLRLTESRLAVAL